MMNLQFEYICISITTECNLKCEYCYRLASKSNRYMSKEDFRVSLEKIKIMGYNTINITGGEPLLHPNIEDFINIAYNLNFKVVLSTNGLFLDLDNPIYNKVHIIDIPLDGANSNINSIIRGEEHFEHIKKILYKYQTKRYNFFLKVNTVMTMYNYDNLLDMAAFLCRFNVYWRLFFCRTIGKYNTINNQFLVSSEMYLNKIREIDKQYPNLLMIEACNRDVENDITFSIIDADCNYIVCQGEKSEIIGNLKLISAYTLKKTILDNGYKVVMHRGNKYTKERFHCGNRTDPN